MNRPTAADVAAARSFIAPYLAPTPLVRCRGLSELLGCDYFVKCENLQPVGAFKVRGGVNLVGQLPADERRAGVIGASTGNHGQSLAFAGSLFDVPVVIYAPAVNANPAKLEAMRQLGARVRLQGRDFDEAREEVERQAAAEGYRYVHSANEPMLIAGVGTMGLEILEDLPDVDVVIVPVGGGSGACGLCVALKEVRPAVQVIGVQSAAAPAAHQSWVSRRLDVEADMATVHEGLATRVPFELTMGLMWDLLDDFVLVDDAQVEAGIRLLARHAHQIAEGAGAASLAAAVALRERLAGKRVAGILSGGNLPMDRLAAVLAADGDD